MTSLEKKVKGVQLGKSLYVQLESEDLEIVREALCHEVTLYFERLLATKTPLASFILKDEFIQKINENFTDTLEEC